MTRRFVRGAVPVLVTLLFVFVADASERSSLSTMTLRRPVLNLSGMINRTTVIPEELMTPAMAQNIGPGSHLIITIPNEGTFGCTANFVWAGNGKTRYLGAAGHCFIPATSAATHGPGADYDASGVGVFVCVSNCSFGGQLGFEFTGDLVKLDHVVYARQTGDGGDVGNDFGIARIPRSFADFVRPAMPVFGGPAVREEIVQQGTPLCHYGNGVVVGETWPTMGRVGVGGGSTAAYWWGDLASAFGDSGSAVNTCVATTEGFKGVGAAGILTHIGFDEATLAQAVFGTTVARAIQMARSDANIRISVVLAQ